MTLETAALPNLGYDVVRPLGPGEIVRITPDGVEVLAPPGDKLQICSFLWVYYGYPASSYEGINVEVVRNRCGAALAAHDDVEVDLVAGIPDSGIGHAIGYASARRHPVPPALRQVHADLAAQLHAAGPARARPGGAR